MKRNTRTIEQIDFQTYIDRMDQRMDQQKQQMDQLDLERRESEKRIREEQKEAEKRTNASIAKIENGFDELKRHMQTMNIAVIIGVAGMIIAMVIGFTAVILTILAMINSNGHGGNGQSQSLPTTSPPAITAEVQP